MVGNVTKNTFITDYQRKARRGIQIDLEGLQNNGTIHHCTISEGETELFNQELELAFDSIPDVYSSILRDRMIGLKYEELAEKFDVPVGTVKNRIFLARQFLQDSLKRPNQTIQSIPMETQIEGPLTRAQKWSNIIEFLKEKLVAGVPTPIHPLDCRDASGFDPATISYLLLTLSELGHLSRKKRDKSNQFLYSIGEKGLDTVDIAEANSRIYSQQRERKQQKDEIRNMPPKAIVAAIESPSKSIPKPAAPKKEPERVMPIGFLADGEYRWFDSDQQAIDAAQIELKNSGTEIILVRQVGSIRLEPKVEIY